MKQQTVRHEWQNKITYPHIMHNCHKCLQFDWFNWTGCVGDDKKVTGTVRCVSWFCVQFGVALPSSAVENINSKSLKCVSVPTIY